MRVKLKLFAPFRELSGPGETEIELDGPPNVRTLLDTLPGAGGSGEKLFDDSGELLSHVVVLVNGRPIKALNGLATGLAEGDEVALLPPVSGG
jgi:MoaD family protein